MIAYMIMCHKNPEQVLRLADHLKTQNSDVFIHCDKRMESHDIEKIIRGGYSTISNRSGMLDDRSLVDIVFDLIKCVKQNEKESNIHYRYYALVSGQDYPIKNVDNINQNLIKNYPQPYIDCTPYSKNNWIFYKFDSKDWLIKIHRMITINIKKGSIIRKIFRAILYVLQKMISCLHMTDYYWFKKKGIDLYGGSAWWILPDKIIDFITKNMNENFSKRLLETRTPEETYFQTMAKCSPLGKYIEVNSPDTITQNCKTWAYFSDEGKPFVGHPYIFTVQEYEKLAQSDRWFARKFDETKDNEILDLLDKLCAGK